MEKIARPPQPRHPHFGRFLHVQLDERAGVVVFHLQEVDDNNVYNARTTYSVELFDGVDRDLLRHVLTDAIDELHRKVDALLGLG